MPEAVLSAEPLPIPKPAVGITMDHHMADFDYPSMSLEKNGGFFQACEKLRTDGVTAQRFDIRWYTLQPEKSGKTDETYLARSKKILEIGKKAGLESNIILSSPPNWAVELARRNPGDFIRAYESYVDTVFSALSADGGQPPAEIQIFNELNTSFTPKELLPHLEACMKIVREKSDLYFQTRIPLTATINVSTPMTLKTVPRMMPESASSFIANHESLLQKFDAVKLDYYPGIWHIPKETLGLYLKNWKYFVDAFRARNSENRVAALPKPIMMFVRSFGNMELLDRVLGELEPFQKRGIKVGISEIGVPTFALLETPAMKESHQKLQALGVSVMMWKLRPLIMKHGITDIGLYSEIDDLTQGHEPLNIGFNWGMVDKDGTPKPLYGKLARLISRVINK